MSLRGNTRKPPNDGVTNDGDKSPVLHWIGEPACFQNLVTAFFSCHVEPDVIG